MATLTTMSRKIRIFTGSTDDFGRPDLDSVSVPLGFGTLPSSTFSLGWRARLNEYQLCYTQSGHFLKSYEGPRRK